MSATPTTRARHARLLAAALATGCVPFALSTVSAGAGHASTTSVTVPLVDDDLVTTTTVCVDDLLHTDTTLCPAPSETTTTTAPVTTTTTSAAAPTTTAPARTSSVGSTGGSPAGERDGSRSSPAGPLGAPAGLGGETVGELPGRAAGVADAVGPGPRFTPRAGARSTLDLIARIGPDASSERVAQLVAPFPVAAPASYSDDFGAYRHGPPVHPHAGADVFAARGAPVVASIDGTVGALTRNGRLGGISLRITAPDGTYLYYAHLNDFAPGLSTGQQVEVGDIVGYVGNTGNARHTLPHVHFEIHPNGGAPVNPTPYLDRWLAEARTRLQLSAPVAGPVAASELDPAPARSGARAPGDNVVPGPVASISALGVRASLDGPGGVPAVVAVAAGAAGWWWITRPRLEPRGARRARWRRRR